jgi:hypothetical protein
LRADPTRRHSTDDPHLDMLLWVIEGLPQPERAGWLRRRMPKTAAMIGVRAQWETLADLDAPRVRV